MFKKFLAATLVMFHVLTFSNPAVLFAGDGAVITDANGNVVAQGNDITLPGGTYNYANADVAAGEIRNITITDSVPTLFNIIDTHTTNIIGTMRLDGPTLIILFNPNGITNNGQITVGNDTSLVLTNLAGELQASDLNLSRGVDQDASMIINNGKITLGQNSNLALVGIAVSNTGAINANGGAVVLAAGDKVSLDITNGAGLIKVQIDEAISTPVFDKNGNKVADAISNTGTIKNDGGVAILSARAIEGIFDNVINHTGTIEANSVGSVNGRIVLNGGDLGITSVSGELNAIGNDLGETGGSIEVYGEKVGLWDGAKINASGFNGGGTVLIGGDYQGLGASPTSHAVYMSKWADIKADALLEGDGGKVIVWGDESAQVHGTISVRGGQLGGNGGLIETSSKGYLDVSEIGIDASAPAGNAGNWLLDPYNISIVAGNGLTNNTGAAAFTPNGNNSQIGVDLINGQLNAGTNVTISTGVAGAQTGTLVLDIAAAIAKTAGTNATLTLTSASSMTLNGVIGATAAFLNVVLNAGGTIALNNSISTNGGSLNVTATGGTSDINFNNAASDINTAGGAVVFNAGDQFNMSNNSSSITTAGGQLDITANKDIDTKTISTGNGAINLTSTTGNISIGQSMTTTGANITANAADGISLSSAVQVSTSGGNFTANANTDADSNGDFSQGAGGSLVSTDAGDINVNAKGIGVTGSFATTSGDINFAATNGDISITNSMTTGTGDINLNATGDVSLKGQNADVTTGGGDFNAHADTDNSGDGDFIQDSGDGVVDTNGGDINIEGDVVKISGTLATGNPANGGDITLTGHAAGTNVDIKSSGLLDTTNGFGGGVFLGGGVNLAGTAITGQGNIILNSVPGPGLDVIITGAIISPTSIFISALRDIIVQALLQTTNPADGNITLRADSDDDGVGGVWVQNTGALDATQNVNIIGSDLFAIAGTQESVQVDVDGANNQIQALGNVTIQTAGFAPAGSNMNLNGIITTPGDLTVNSVGNINTSNNGVAELKANNLNLNSVTGIDAEIDANNVAYNNTTSGNVGLEDFAGGLTVTGATNGGAGSTTITTHSPLTIAANIVQAGAISLNAGEVAGAGDNLTINNGVTVRSTGGGVTLNAGDNIALGTGSLVQSDTSAVNMVAGFGDADGLGSISLGGLVSGLTFVIMNAVQNITDNNGASNNISAGGVNATAATGIDFDSTVTDITALNTGTGNINIDEADFVNVNSVVANNGNVTVTNASNNMLVSTVTATNGTATLTSTLGGIVDNNAGANNVTANALVANAGLGIDLDTDVNQLTLNTGAGNDAYIDNNGTVNLNDSTIGRDLSLTVLPGDLTISGTVNVGRDTNLTANAGGITQTAGSITTQDLTFSSGGATSLTSAGNNLASISGAAGSSINLGGSGANTEIGNLSTVGNTITYNHSGAGAVNVTGNVTTGNGVTNGGTITINNLGGFLTVKNGAVLSTVAGAGGALFASNVTIEGGSTLTLGAGDIVLNGGGLDLIINVPIISNTSIFLSALRDIIVDALVQTTNPADGNITLRADSDNDGVGGVWLRAGEVDAAQNVDIMGSDLWAVAGTLESILVDADGGNKQISADGNIWLHTTGFAPAGSDMIINGIVETPGTLTIDSVGNVTTTNNGDAELFANNLAITAVEGIDAEIDANTAAYLNTTSGNVRLEDLSGGLTIGTVGTLVGGTNNGGATTIETHSPLTIAANVSSLGNVSLNALNNTIVDDLTLNSGVTVSSTSGSILLTAGHDIIMNANSLVTVNGTNTITAAAGEDFTNAVLDADGQQNGSLDMNATAALRSQDGNIIVDAKESARISEINADSNNDGTRGNVNILARDGYISDNNGATTNIIADDLTLNAELGIGDAAVAGDDEIETNVNTVDSFNGTSGHVNIVEVDAGGDLDIVSAVQAGNGDHNIRTTNGTLEVLAGGSGVSSQNGETTLLAQDSDNSGNDHLVINNTVTSTGDGVTLNSGKINLDSQNDVQFSVAGDVTSTNGEIEVDATDFLTMSDNGADATLLSTGTGQIDLDAGLDITLAGVATGSTADDAVVVVTRGGRIIDGGDFYTNVSTGALVEDPSIFDGGLLMSAFNGIGVDTDANGGLETKVGKLAAYNNSDDIQVFNNGALEITTLTDPDATTSLGFAGVGTISGVTLDNQAGSFIFITAASPMVVNANVTNNAGGFNNITLYALGNLTTDTMTINADIQSLNGDGNIFLASGGSMFVNNGSEIRTSSQNPLIDGFGNIVMAAGIDATGSGPVPNGLNPAVDLTRDGNSNADLIMASDSHVLADGGNGIVGGNIQLNAERNLLVAEVNADQNANGVRGDLITNSFTGDTLDSNDVAPNVLNTMNMTGDHWDAFSGGVIGLATNPIESTVNVFNALAFGDIFVSNIGDVLINLTSQNGSIGFSTDGDIFLGGAHASGGDTSLAASGSILAVNSGTHVTASGNINLAAGGVIGRGTAGINTQLNNPGTLTLTAGGTFNGISANVGGNFGESSVTILAAPGLVLFNNLAIGGEGINGLSQNLNQLFVETLPFNQLSTGRLDGRYAVDFPGFFDAQYASQAPLVSIDTTRLDTLPVLEALPPTVVPVPGTAAPERPLRAPEAPRTAAPAAPQVQGGQNPPTVVPIPAEAVPTLEKDVENR